jgi:two-component system sensor kinase FixL
MGEMVAGIAHELNQPLYSIVNFSKACRNVLSAGNRPDMEQLRDWTEEIASAAARAGAIVTQLRGFARRSESLRLLVPVNEIVEESVQLVASEAQWHRAAVRLELADRCAMVKVDRIQIQQVMVNLLRNAYEAMDDDRVAPRQATIRTELAGDTVEVSVADTGPGLPDDPSLSIFDPFVTTKPEGLGMGLAISTTIVESHGGKIWAGMNRQGGATFYFTLPLAREDRADGE